MIKNNLIEAFLLFTHVGIIVMSTVMLTKLGGSFVTAVLLVFVGYAVLGMVIGIPALLVYLLIDRLGTSTDSDLISIDEE